MANCLLDTSTWIPPRHLNKYFFKKQNPSPAFLYTNDEKSESEIKKTLPTLTLEEQNGKSSHSQDEEVILITWNGG